MISGLVQLNAPTLTHLVGSRADPTLPHSPSCLFGSGSNPHLFGLMAEIFFQVWWVHLKGEIVTLMGHYSTSFLTGLAFWKDSSHFPPPDIPITHSERIRFPPCFPLVVVDLAQTPSPLLIPSGSCASRTPWFTLVNTHLFSSESKFWLTQLPLILSPSGSLPADPALLLLLSQFRADPAYPSFIFDEHPCSHFRLLSGRFPRAI